jgi:hypothetical protein
MRLSAAIARGLGARLIVFCKAAGKLRFVIPASVGSEDAQCIDRPTNHFESPPASYVRRQPMPCPHCLLQCSVVSQFACTASQRRKLFGIDMDIVIVGQS